MKYYIEISRNTETQAQFLAQCRAVLKNHPCPVYASWLGGVNAAKEEMKEIEDGKREKYYHHHKADDERQFDEICAASATEYQIYLNRKDEHAFYNFILEWEDGHGYFYCIDSMAEEPTTATEPEQKDKPTTIGMIRTICPACGDSQKVQVTFPAYNHGFLPAEHICTGCGEHLTVTDQYYYNENGTMQTGGRDNG